MLPFPLSQILDLDTLSPHLCVSHGPLFLFSLPLFVSCFIIQNRHTVNIAQLDANPEDLSQHDSHLIALCWKTHTACHFVREYKQLWHRCSFIFLCAVANKLRMQNH